ncbi:hypothetical protein LTR70_000809 [Exophiala xenobiotica]|uniref:Uncharacterized protein n=1 Tax=Lithohypha guttulata TaxID=1690604 RepID=A0ABR0KN45_9EURO|nr:hypothetical protein LTR24_000518 [Lithohypha guttulata]KAK5329312.1 hypothetical protein LTR70_000809 [Exophiala xenobiotica]
MTQPVIAVDMDDVLANTNEVLYQWHNKKYSTDLKLQEDAKYFHQWLNRGWGDEKTTRAKLQAFEESPEWDAIPGEDGAIDALKHLQGLGYSIVVVTARGPEKARPSQQFLLKHYPDVFDAVYFCKDTEKDEIRKAVSEPTKQELFGERGQDEEPLPIIWHPGPKSDACKHIGAEFLIDDSVENAFEVLGHGPTGIKVPLFGPYLWNHQWVDMSKPEFKDLDYDQRMKEGFVDDTSLMDLPDQVVRCVDWPQVQSFITNEARRGKRKVVPE